MNIVQDTYDAVVFAKRRTDSGRIFGEMFSLKPKCVNAVSQRESENQTRLSKHEEGQRTTIAPDHSPERAPGVHTSWRALQNNSNCDGKRCASQEIY